MDLALRTQKLKSSFSYDSKAEIIEDNAEIIPFLFSQKLGENEVLRFQDTTPIDDICSTTDRFIRENTDFKYTVFAPKSNEKFSNAILLLHGLNERSWEKYLPWAEYLCKETGKPVILFPIAFHMNRGLQTWSSPRGAMPWVEKRKQKITGLINATFVNIALSSRLSLSPLRFYISGRESLFNLVQLTAEIKTGLHPLFEENTSVNIFAYSIGALLAQVIMLSNPCKLFTDTKFSLFCGGSIFEKMNGSAREIMDQEAFQKVYDFYTGKFSFKDDKIEDAFKSMVLTSANKNEREKFFEEAERRLQVITLKKDMVIPTCGAIEALGEKASKKSLCEMDFPFDYTHQNPFPLNKKIAPEELSGAFIKVFSKVAAFL